MLNKIKDFFTEDKAIPAIADQTTDSAQFRKLRWSVFLSATFGYALYYVCRLSLNVVKTPLVEEGILSESELGIMGSALFFAYAGGKFVNGFLADRSNIRKFMATGLLLSAIISVVLGFTTSFIIFTVLWGLNGWVQSMGVTPSVVALSRWYRKSMGTYYGFWSAAHNMGESFTYVAIAALASYAGWQWGFWGASLAGFAGVAIIYFFLHDSPESKGYYPEDAVAAKSETMQSVGKQQLEVLKNPYIWILALSSCCMYVGRYAVNSWGIFFLENHKAYSNFEASSIVSVNAISGIVGTVLSGVVSDKFFGGRRNMPALLFGILNALAITIFVYNPKGNPWIDIGSMILFGVTIGALLCYLGGLMAVDIASKKAAGAAMGVVGIASYIGAGIQDIISGSLIESSKIIVNGKSTYNFDTIAMFWIGASVVSFLIATLAWNAKSRRDLIERQIIEK